MDFGWLCNDTVTGTGAGRGQSGAAACPERSESRDRTDAIQSLDGRETLHKAS